MRCHGSKRYALRCKNLARTGCITCHLHADQDAWLWHNFADRIAEEGGPSAGPQEAKP